MDTLRSTIVSWASAAFPAATIEEAPPGGRPTMHFPVPAKTAGLRIFLEIDEDVRALAVFTCLDRMIPEDRRLEVVRLCGLANLQQWLGSWELTQEGLVRFRCGVVLADATPTPDLLIGQVMLGTIAFETFEPLLTRVVFGESTAEEALTPADTADGPTDAPAAAPAGAGHLRDWDSFRGLSPIREWAGRVANRSSALRADDAPARAVLLVGDDEDACEEVARLVAREAKLRFARVPRDEVLELSSTTLRSFVGIAPTLVFLQPGLWLLPAESPLLDKEAQTKNKSLHRTLMRFLRELESTKQVVLITTAGNRLALAEPLLEAGGFDQSFEVPEPSPTALGELFVELVGRDRCAHSLLGDLSKLGKAVALAFGGRVNRELATLQLRRLAAREDRKVEFVDLIDLFTRGFIDAIPSTDRSGVGRERIAAHEAGHAAMAVIDSGGGNIPDFSTIVPANQFRGVVVSSLAHLHDEHERYTYLSFRHRVRVMLAGRAAEELVFGPTGVGTGVTSDLEKATRLSHLAFSTWGYAPAMDTAEASRSNLAVVVGPPAPSEVDYVVAMVRAFLSQEYSNVLVRLNEHRAFVEAVRDRLLVDAVVDRDELAALSVAHGLPIQHDAPPST